MARMALEDITIADFSWVWAGPQVTKLAAEMGARVIKVESANATSTERSLPPWPPPKHEQGLNTSGFFNMVGRNKLGVTLNLRNPEAIELAKQIIAVSDIMIENFSAGVMERLGLGYDVVKEVKPDIIYISMPPYGFTGPYKNYISYGRPQIYISGLAEITGYPDQPPYFTGMSWADPVAAAHAAFAMLSALHYRDNTGEGQFIELSQWETMMCFIPQMIMDYTLNGRIQTRMGNDDYIMAPHNCYRCQGEMEWVAIAVATDEEWEAFCHALGDPEWCKDERFADGYLRWKNQDELDKLVEGWTAGHTAYEVMHILQEAGVAAAPVLSNKGLAEDPHLNAREWVVEVDHPEIGRMKYSGLLWKMSKTPGGVYRHAPLFGEHNEYVFGELLGMPKDEITRLIEDKVIY